ncbi:MAG: hypothetical protein JKX76_15290 [Colwellia sp.]|nr:hypothetical protein [Colwellia sp.]
MNVNLKLSTIKKEKLVDLIIQSLCISTVLFTILYYLAGYFAIPTEYSEPSREFKFIYENLVLKFYAVVNGSLLILLYLTISRKIVISYMILLSSLTFLIIILVSIKFPTSMYYFALINIYVLFYIFTKYNYEFKLSKITIFILLIYLITPIILVSFVSLHSILEVIPPLYFSESFRGFSFDRVFYSLLVGYMILVILVEKNFRYILPILIYGLFIAESRAAILAVFIAIVYYYKSSRKIVFTVSVLGVVFILLYILFSNRSDITTDGDRLNFYIYMLYHLISSPKVFLFGSGEFYTSIKSINIIPHNWVLQTILNFGVIGLFTWTVLLYNLWLKLNLHGRVFLVYQLILGLLQPGYDALMLLPFSAFGYYLAIFYGRDTKDIRI